MTQTAPDQDPMSWLDFVASMTGSLAWPISAVAIALVFRTQIRSLIGRLNEIGIGDAKAKFAKDLDFAEQKAEALPVASEAPDGRTDDAASSTKEGAQNDALSPRSVNQEDALIDARRMLMDRYGVDSSRFAALLDISPAAAILDTWKTVERTLHRLAARVDLNMPARRLMAREVTYRLLEANYIKPDVADLIAQLQDMRNKAAHGVEPSVTDAVRFRDISNRVAEALRSATPGPGQAGAMAGE